MTVITTLVKSCCVQVGERKEGVLLVLRGHGDSPHQRLDGTDGSNEVRLGNYNPLGAPVVPDVSIMHAI